MDDTVKMFYLRTIAECDDPDAVLLSFLYQAQNVILNRMYPYLPDSEFAGKTVPEKYVWKQIRIASYMISKRGAEGEVSHSENGTSRSYGSADVPEEMLRDILPMVDVPR